MKKAILLSFVFILLFGCAYTKKEEASKDRVTTIEEIDYDSLVEKLGQNEDFLLYIGRPDCGDCKEFYPYLETYVDQTNQGIYYLNIQNFRDNAKKEDASEQEKTFYENLQKNLDFDWTPTLVRYVNGKVKAKYTFLDLDYYKIEDGEKQKEKYQEFLDEFYTWMKDNY
mgnify:FL=1